MKKRNIVLLVCLCFLFSVTGCSKKDKEITLNLAFGERSGIYTGDLVDGIPDGNGKFTTQNSDGEEWTYEGSFKSGHFEGEGKITWKNGFVEVGTFKDDVIVPISDSELNQLYSKPEDYKGRYVEIIGKVFAIPQYEEEGMYLQIWGDIKNADNNAIVYIPDKEFTVHEDEYIKIVGPVTDKYVGTNIFGGEVTAPVITARQYELLSYMDAVSPTLQSVEINETQTQYGYSVTLQKVEFSEQETRVYLKVVNNGSDKFNLYSFNAKIIQDGTQYEEQSNWEADYPEVQTDLLVGSSTEGIIAFPSLENKSFTLFLECSSENWREDIEPYLFSVEP